MLSIDAPPVLQVTEAGNAHHNVRFAAVPVNTDQQAFFMNISISGENGKQPLQELRTITYDHIPRIDYFRPARVKTLIADVQTSGRRIGYIEGAGDKVPAALLQMGYEVVMLREKDITPSALSSFDAVITGVRAYNVHEWLTDKYEALMDYVKGGGNLVVQYNTVGFGGPLRAKMGPWPFNITRNRVTDEHAEVRFLQPGHPVLQWPNRITEKDFDGWIQERGIYFADQADSNYHAVLSMHDPGEADQTGSLLVGDYGKGKFVYTGLVFFRELPAGVAGAYRLLANIIAPNGKKPN
jgi:hypothetical protein